MDHSLVIIKQKGILGLICATFSHEAVKSIAGVEKAAASVVIEVRKDAESGSSRVSDVSRRPSWETEQKVSY